MVTADRVKPAHIERTPENEHTRQSKATAISKPTAGVSKQATHPLKKASATVSALMSTISMASGQRVKRSTHVNKYLKPSE